MAVTTADLARLKAKYAGVSNMQRAAPPSRAGAQAERELEAAAVAALAGDDIGSKMVAGASVMRSSSARSVGATADDDSPKRVSVDDVGA